MDYILDRQLMFLYALKILRIALTYFAMFLALKIFLPEYEDLVYDQQKPPPSLTRFLWIALAFDVALNIMMIVSCVLLKQALGAAPIAQVFDKTFFSRYAVDYVITTALFLIFAVVIARVMQSKKHFKYRYEGQRAIRAYREIAFGISVVACIFPACMFQ